MFTHIIKSKKDNAKNKEKRILKKGNKLIVHSSNKECQWR